MSSFRNLAASAMAALIATACLSLPSVAATVAKPKRIEISSSPATVADGEVCEQAERTAASWRNGESGTTELLILVNPDGTVADTKVAATSGFDGLDGSTIAAVKKCRFNPLMKKAAPVAAWFPYAQVWENAVSDPELDKEVPCARPAYPRESLRRDEQGVVTLRSVIGEDGAVIESQIAWSSGFPILDEAARAALAKCRFKPGMQKGKPVQGVYKQQYEWKLN